jgi:N-formylmaleamate deformylase
MSEPESTFLDGPAGRLRVLSHGSSGPDVLLLPGITSPAATWSFAARRLSIDRRVHVLDLRGRGCSSAPEDGAYRVADHAADAAAAIDALGLHPPVVIGHSLGARVGARLAVERPSLQTGLLLAEPPVTGPERTAGYPLPLSFYFDGIRSATAGMDLAAARALEPEWDDDRLRDRIRWLPTCRPEAVGADYEHFHDEDFHAVWDRLERPVLLYGDRSPVVTAADAEELLERNPTARAVVVADAGHMLPWNALDAFLGAVEGELPAGTGAT